MDYRAVNLQQKKDDNALRSTQSLRTDDTEQSASLAKQGLQSESYAMRTQNWHQGNCEHCQADFKKKTTWQKFCCENCRIAAYELRTGKRVNLKKTG